MPLIRNGNQHLINGLSWSYYERYCLLVECNGFCGVNDFNPVNETDKEINYQFDMFKE